MNSRVIVLEKYMVDLVLGLLRQPVHFTAVLGYKKILKQVVEQILLYGLNHLEYVQ